jgi:orotate phosphoribosyltransferase
LACQRTEAEVVALLQRHGALQQGHFLLSSGMHSSHYVQCALLLQYPELTARICAALAEPFRGVGVQVVVGPAVGAVVLAYETARQLGARALWAERSEGKLTLRRSFRVEPGERVLVVEDVVTTGGSAGRWPSWRRRRAPLWWGWRPSWTGPRATTACGGGSSPWRGWR